MREGGKEVRREGGKEGGLADFEKMNSMNSAEFNFLKDFLPNLQRFLPNLDP